MCEENASQIVPPQPGDTRPCPLCDDEGNDGTWTWTERRGTDGEILDEFVCDQRKDRQHNRRLNEPL